MHGLVVRYAALFSLFVVVYLTYRRLRSSLQGDLFMRALREPIVNGWLAAGCVASV